MSRAEQLPLPLERDEMQLKGYFEKATARTVSLTMTDNSTSLLSVREKGALLFVRLHRIFLDAGEDVIGEIAQFLIRQRGKTPLLRSFLRRNEGRMGKKPPRKIRLATAGRHHDLREIFDAVNDAYFGGRIRSAVTWGTGSSRSAVRKRTLGSYSRHTRVIRVNPVLDRRKVPRYFVEFVVYHEMLHADTETMEKNGRRLVHSKEFRRREKAFRDYHKAIAWERKGRF
ncbi:MAG: SprT-like domain-containing protein [Nitrospirae bacterium]|nr:SprT-like domain-containing protein [Nitrospirota bacterium]